MSWLGRKHKKGDSWLATEDISLGPATTGATAKSSRIKLYPWKKSTTPVGLECSALDEEKGFSKHSKMGKFPKQSVHKTADFESDTPRTRKKNKKMSIALVILVMVLLVLIYLKVIYDGNDDDPTEQTPAPTVSVNQTRSPTFNDDTESPTMPPIDTNRPSSSPTYAPTKSPTRNPTVSPTQLPTRSPVIDPINDPTVSPSLSPTQDIKLFPEETRNGDDFVGIMFLDRPSDGAISAFRSAAEKWSNIVRGTFVGSFQISDICGTPIDTFNIDHLVILASTPFIDGVGSVLGRAGPCGAVGGVALIGQMLFDSADIDRLELQGSLESVILHEMGHVLGIGSLFQFIGLFVDAQNVTNPVIDVQPKMIGNQAIAEYTVLKGTQQTFVPIENGFTNGIRNTAGQGSLNSHWDEDEFELELMSFSLSITRPPLSAVTIAALGDLGYTIDISEAEDFVLPIETSSSSKLQHGSESTLYMVKDVIDFPVKQLDHSDLL